MQTLLIYLGVTQAECTLENLPFRVLFSETQSSVYPQKEARGYLLLPLN